MDWNALKRSARWVGILTLAMTGFAIFAMLYVPGLAVPGDATATAQNILAAEGILRLGMASSFIVVAIEVLLIVVLYDLVKPVSKTFARAAAFARLAMTTLQGLNLLNHLTVLQFLSGANYLNAFQAEQRHAFVLLLMNAHKSVELLWGLFFALHLALLGALVFKSGYIARWLGVVLLAASACYWVQGMGMLLWPAAQGLWTTIGLLSIVELAFPIWLLVKGIKEPPEG
jgi:hypothetical protein